MYQYWNPNPAAAKVGDCTVRAISKATKQTWEETYIQLALYGLMLSDMPSANAVWGAYLKDYSYSSEPDSEFKEIARNADFEHLLRVLDEHMKAIEAMYPREYRSVLRKIKEGA